MHRLSRKILDILGAAVHVSGTPPRTGLIVCNHLGYLDVLAIGAVCPAIFVAKSEVKAWPVVGSLCRTAGTIFASRNRRMSAAQTAGELHCILRIGTPVVLFPEGTSSDGTTVLPFKSSLLSVAETSPISIAAISYELPGANAAKELCYWGDMIFAPHFWNVLGKSAFEIHLEFKCHRPSRQKNRKLLAAALQAEIRRLRDPSAESPTRT
jgi:1-acyl-sn-glycerol-3-phosphate acyltransferase